jgi:hypothetical protein
MTIKYLDPLEKCNYLIKKYEKHFGKDVPMFVLFYNTNTIIRIIEKALRENKEIK